MYVCRCNVPAVEGLRHLVSSLCSASRRYPTALRRRAQPGNRCIARSCRRAERLRPLPCARIISQALNELAQLLSLAIVMNQISDLRVATGVEFSARSESLLTRRGHPDNRCRSFATDFCDRVAQIDPDFFGREFADPMSTRCSLVCQHRQSSVLAGSVCFLPGR